MLASKLKLNFEHLQKHLDRVAGARNPTTGDMDTDGSLVLPDQTT